MKSYFATLAARATLANVPVTSPATTTNLQDPFDDTATVVSTSSPQNVVPQSRTSDRHETSSVQVPPMKENDTSQVGTVTSDLRFEATTQTQSAVVQEQTRQKSESRTPREPYPLSQRDRQETRSEVRSAVEKSEQVLEPVMVPRETQSPVSPKKKETNAKSESEIDVRSAEDEREQSVLLQKADAFMKALFERRSEERPDRESALETKEPAALEGTFRDHAVARLEPAPVAARPTESGDESPSLVIGKLTVEVMPPAPPPIAPARQVIVVRGDRSARSHSIGSSQRFGLGQF
ncbi:MAG TPA: hypothetical protein VL866_05185 [Pyrinomonadaceae bacterium]|nr:hypothetical protein [Pyrinomonadaceae bacterium]